MAFSGQEKKLLFSLGVVTALRILGFSLLLPVFVLYAQEFTSSPFLIGFALGAYGFTQAILQVPFGMLSDRWGRKPLILIGLVIFGLGSLMGIRPELIAQVVFGDAAKTIHVLIFCRLLQGGGAIISVIYAYVADVIPVGKRNAAMAWVGMPIGLAISGGIMLGPILGAKYGFSSLFVLTSILIGLAFLYCLFFLPEPPRHEHHADVELDSRDLGQVLRNTQFLRLNYCGFITDLIMTSLFFVLPFILAQSLEVKRFWIIYAPMLVVGIGVMFLGSRFADRGKTREVFVAAYLAMGGGFVLLSLGGIGWVLAGTVLVYSGVSVLHPVMPTTVTKIVPRKFLGTATGVFNFFTYFGAGMGGAGAGFISQRWGTLGLLYGMAGLALSAGMMALSLNRRPRHNK